MQLRPMRVADLEPVAALSLRADPYGWTQRNFADALGAGDMVCLAVEPSSGIIAGYVATRTVLDESEVLDIAVDPAFQGRGIGTFLLSCALDTLRHSGIATVFLEVRVDNVPAGRMYEKAGFVQIGLRRNYYRRGNVRVDARLMQLTF